MEAKLVLLRVNFICVANKLLLRLKPPEYYNAFVVYFCSSQPLKAFYYIYIAFLVIW